MTIQTLVVGGEWTFATTFISKANARGFDLEMKKHISVDSIPSSATPKCDLILVLKDFVSHRLCDWAKAEADRLSIKFCETSQKISIAVSDLSHILGITPKEELMPTTTGLYIPTDLEIIHDLATRTPYAFIAYYPDYASLRKKYIEAIFTTITKALAHSTKTQVNPNRMRRRQNADKVSDLFARYARALKGQDDEARETVHSMIIRWANDICFQMSQHAQVPVIQTIAKTLFGYNFTASELEELEGNLNRVKTLLNPSSPIHTQFLSTDTFSTPPTPQPQEVRTEALETRLLEETKDKEDMSEYTITPLMQALHDNPYQIIFDDWVNAYLFAEGKLGLTKEEAHAQISGIQDISRSRQGSPVKVFLYEMRLKWAQDYLTANADMFANLTEFKPTYKKVWGVRIPDVHGPILTKHLDMVRAQSMVREGAPAPTPTPAPISEPTTSTPSYPSEPIAYEPPAPNASTSSVVSIGPLMVTLTQGSQVYISEISADSVEVDGCAKVAISKVEHTQGVTKLFGVSLTF